MLKKPERESVKISKSLLKTLNGLPIKLGRVLNGVIILYHAESLSRKLERMLLKMLWNSLSLFRTSTSKALFTTLKTELKPFSRNTRRVSRLSPVELSNLPLLAEVTKNAEPQSGNTPRNTD